MVDLSPEAVKKREARAAAVRRWRERNPDKVKAANDAKRGNSSWYQKNRETELQKSRDRYNSKSKDERKDMVLRRQYGITLAEYNEMFRLQEYKCAACGSDTPQGDRGWHVDHCHDQGHVRGILCGLCNAGLGQAKDSIETLHKWIDYLTRTAP